MRRPPIANVYSKAIPVDGGTYTVGYIVFDGNRQILSLGVEDRHRLPRKRYANRLAVREAIESLLRTHKPEKTVIRAPDVKSPGLELGRLDPEVRKETQMMDFTTEVTLQNHCQKLVYGLLDQKHEGKWRFNPDKTELTEPLTVFIDGSHRPLEDQSTVGHVVVDDEGDILIAGGKKVGCLSGSLEAEVRAARIALEKVNEFATTVGVNLYSDNSTLVRGLNGESMPPRVDAQVKEARTQLHIGGGSSAKELSREKNTLSDALADIAHDEAIALKHDPTEGLPPESKKSADTKYSV